MLLPVAGLGLAMTAALLSTITIAPTCCRLLRFALVMYFASMIAQLNQSQYVSMMKTALVTYSWMGSTIISPVDGLYTIGTGLMIAVFLAVLLKFCRVGLKPQKGFVMGTVVLIVLVILLLGGFSGFGGGLFYGTGYYGGGGLGLILVIVLILVLLGRF